MRKICRGRKNHGLLLELLLHHADKRLRSILLSTTTLGVREIHDAASQVD